LRITRHQNLTSSTRQVKTFYTSDNSAEKFCSVDVASGKTITSD